MGDRLEPMSLALQSEAAQFGTPPSRRIHEYATSSMLFTRRKDVLTIKSRLLALVDNPEYWTTLARFIHGECPKAKFEETMALYLKTNEAKILHNDLIRAIIFNAHFSVVPPPGVEVPASENPNRAPRERHLGVPRLKDHGFVSVSAADLGHLPSISQLRQRIAARGLNSDDRALEVLLTEQRKFVTLVLHRCLSGSLRQWNQETSITIDPGQIAHLLKSDSEIASVVGPSILAKCPLH